MEFYKPVSRSCAVAKNKKNLAGHWTIKLGRQNRRRFHWPKFSYVSTKIKFGSFFWVFVYQDWLSSGLPKVSTCSYCAWLWNWFIGSYYCCLWLFRSSRLSFQFGSRWVFWSGATVPTVGEPDWRRSGRVSTKVLLKPRWQKYQLQQVDSCCLLRNCLVFRESVIKTKSDL